jgi:hypothetical protein
VSAFAASATQAVRVPEFTALTIDSAGSIGAQPWNGSVGGIVAALVSGTLSNNASAVGVSANGIGFRAGSYADDSSGATGCSGLDEAASQGARKGEGIALTRYGATQTGRGRVANGAGGGVCVRSGGGGGGNGGAGGQGGNSDLGSDGNRAVGGEGGGALSAASERQVLLLGGGGGAGHGSNAGNGNGAAGGGVIFLRLGALAGSGGMQARGSAAAMSADGGGGGGAGGSIYLRVAGTVSCGTLDARGGTGGNSSAIAVGPGGGGGGGRIVQQSGSGLCATSVLGAAPGTQADSAAPGGAAYGAQAGANGVVTTLPDAYVRSAAPTLLTPANGSVTSNPMPAISGTSAQPGRGVAVYVDGALVQTPTADASGNFSSTVPVPLADGAHQAQAAVYDEGDLGLPSTPAAFTVDTTPPSAPFVITPADGTTVGSSQPEITGTTDPNTTVTVVIDGVAGDSTSTDNSGNWALTPTTPLADGSHTVRARATDGAGNTGPDSDTNTFTVDTTPPAAPVVTTPADGAVTADARPALGGTAEPDITIDVYVDDEVVGSTIADAGTGDWSFTPGTALADGPHTLKAVARDAVGNHSADSNRHSFTVDTTSPPAPVVTSPQDGSVVVDSQPLLSGTAEPDSAVTLTIDDTDVGVAPVDGSGNWQYTPAALADGAHTLKARATDAVGNVGPYSDSVSFSVDSSDRLFANGFE